MSIENRDNVPTRVETLHIELERKIDPILREVAAHIEVCTRLLKEPINFETAQTYIAGHGIEFDIEEETDDDEEMPEIDWEGQIIEELKSILDEQKELETEIENSLEKKDYRTLRNIIENLQAKEKGVTTFGLTKPEWDELKAILKAFTNELNTPDKHEPSSIDDLFKRD